MLVKAMQWLLKKQPLKKVAALPLKKVAVPPLKKVAVLLLKKAAALPLNKPQPANKRAGSTWIAAGRFFA
jgi:hypothetical protein